MIAMTDRGLVGEVRSAAARLSTAMNNAANVGLLVKVSIDTTEVAALNHPHAVSFAVKAEISRTEVL